MQKSAVRKRKLDLVKAGARADDVAAAQAGVDAAQASLEQAQSTLTDTELRAPFAGVVAFLDASVGEPAVLGNVVARVGGQGEWEIETTDLTELNVVNVHEGTGATVTLERAAGC